MITSRVTGLNKVLGNMGRQSSEILAKQKRALKKGGLFVQRESMKLVPVRTGNLRGSAFTRQDGDNDVLVGYTANYAVFVHEDLNATHKPGKTAKFLERVIREKKLEIIEVIKEEL